LLLRKAGDVAEDPTRAVTQAELGHIIAQPQDGHLVTINVIRPAGPDQARRSEYKVPVEAAEVRPVALTVTGDRKDKAAPMQ